MIARMWRPMAALSTLMLVALGATGCQDAIEPGEELSIPVGVTITVQEQSGTPLPDANVRLNPINGFGPATRTVADGSVRYDDVPVPIIGQMYEVTIELPTPREGRYIDARRIAPRFNENPTFDGTTIRDTIFLPCRDVRILYRVGIATTFACGSSRADRFPFSFCLEDRTSDTLCTPLFTHSCPAPVTFALPDPGIAGMSLVGLDANNVSLGSTFTIDPGRPFSICAIFTTGGPTTVPPRTVTVTGTGGGTLTQQLTFSAFADSCVACDCPDNAPSVLPVVDSACVGSSTFTELDLGSFINTGEEDCTWEFEIEQDFSSGVVQLVDLPAPIPGGTAGGLAEIRFSPTSSGTIRDSAILRIYRNSGGVRAVCGQAVTVRFTGTAGAFGCSVDSVRSTIFRNTAVQPFFICVDFSDPKTLVVANNGPCPLDVEAIINNLTSSGVFRVSPTTGIIEPDDTLTFTISFNPTRADVWTNGRGNGPGRVIFNGELLLGGDCTNIRIPLRGTADTLCRGSRVQIMHQWGANSGQWFEGIIINEQNNSIQYVNDNVAQGANITGQRDLWIESVNLAAGRAVIGSDLARWQVVDNRPPSVSGESACDIANNYLGQCGTGATGTLTVQLWDVIVFTLPGGQCGIIWITNIANDSPSLGTPSVTTQICYPL